MAGFRLLGLTFLLLAVLGCAVEGKSHFFKRRTGGTVISENVFYFRNYYRFPIKWYTYSDQGRTRQIFAYTQNEFYDGRFPGASFYTFPKKFQEGNTYYGEYRYGNGFSKIFKFTFKFSFRRFGSGPTARPITLTAYPEKGSGSAGFEDDPSFQDTPSDFGSS